MTMRSLFLVAILLISPESAFDGALKKRESPPDPCEYGGDVIMDECGVKRSRLERRMEWHNRGSKTRRDAR